MSGRKLRPYVPGAEDMTLAARNHVREAIALLRQAGARKAADRLRAVEKSVEGADRHALRLAFRYNPDRDRTA